MSSVNDYFIISIANFHAVIFI